MYKNITLVATSLVETPELESIIEHIKAHYKISPTLSCHSEIFDSPEDNRLYLLYLTDSEIKLFFKNHIDKNLHMGIVPNKESPLSVKKYALSKDIFEAIDDAFDRELLSRVDILMCNELMAFNRITIGSMRGLNQIELLDNKALSKIGIFFKNLFTISFNKYSLTTEKEQEIQTVASGITIIENEASSEKAAISEELSMHDGKLNAFILAPTSLLSYLWYLISLFIYQKISMLSLPKSMGFIKTKRLLISSNKPMDYILDGDLLSTKEIELVTYQDAITLHLGKKLKEHVRYFEHPLEEKESVKIASLPRGEVTNFLMESKLPLFKKASEDEFKDLFLALRSSANFSSIYLTLMILSTLLATTGLFANSAPVIIGAMILAPLMAPIVSLSMGVVRADRLLLIQSIKTLAIGISMALLFSFLFTYFISLDKITIEMQSRLNPNLLDLMVAIFSGIAGAYASSKQEVTKSLAGVAIAVALVPPLSVTGIGLGLANWDMIYGSFLLFSANLIGMTLSAALTFIVLGFSPVKRAKKGLIYTFVVLVIITIPLILSFYEMKKQNNYFQNLSKIKSITIDNKKVNLNILGIDDRDNKLTIRLEAISSKALNNGDFDTIKNQLRAHTDKDIVLVVSPKIIVE